MNSNAQGSIEYLSTYGLGLILIISVASILFFVISPSEDVFQCRSTDPTKIILKSQNFRYNASAGPACGAFGTGECAFWGSNDDAGNSFGEIVLQNATGEKISGLNYTGTWKAFTPGNCVLLGTGTANPEILPMEALSEQEIIVKEAYIYAQVCGGIDFTKLPKEYKLLTVEYNNASGDRKSADIICSGYPQDRG
ncbi:MAG: hypothetical protein JW772_05075 [Candidatus Diapherotrites archaeon]|nr:hypothetical protein [Candidatus Diapherotrites archaeon]